MRIYEFDQLTPETILNRNIQAEENVDAAVDEVLAAVRTNGDVALREYTKKFDGVDLAELRVSEQEIEAAWASLEPEFIRTLELAADNIRVFHERQVHQDFRLERGKTASLWDRDIRPLKRWVSVFPAVRWHFPPPF